MDIRTALADTSLLSECDQLVSKRIKDPDRAQEVAQEIYLELLETPQRNDWTRQEILDAFGKQINAVNCRLRRLYGADSRSLNYRKPKTYNQPRQEQNHADIQNLDLISQLPTNLKQTALLLYNGYTRQDIMTEQRISESMYTRRRIAIQEILL